MVEHIDGRKESPQIPLSRPDAEGLLPREGESYYGEAWDYQNPSDRIERLVLARDLDHAKRILVLQAIAAFRVPTPDIDVEVVNLLPQQFLEHERRMIGEGRILPDFITKYGNLRDYQEKARRNNAGGPKFI